MRKYKYYFLVGSCVLIFMGAFVKLSNLPNYQASFIAGLLNALIFVILSVKPKIDVKD